MHRQPGGVLFLGFFTLEWFCVTSLPKTSHPAFALKSHWYSAAYFVDLSTPAFWCSPKNHSDTKQAAEDDMHKIIPCILFMLSELSLFSLLRNRSHWFCACLVQHCLWFILYENRIIFIRKSQNIFSTPHLDIVKLRNLLYGRRPLFLTEMYVGSTAHFRAVTQYAGYYLHLQLLREQQTCTGMAQHMTATGRQIKPCWLQ